MKPLSRSDARYVRIWRSLTPKKSAKSKKGKSGNEEKQRLHRLSLLLTLLAAAFFTGTTWALGRDGKIGFSDGLVLVGIFLFWQVFHLYDVLKANAQQKGAFGFMLLANFALLMAGAYAVYISTDQLVKWVQSNQNKFIAQHLGWLSGWLMALPNALLALYYAAKRRAEVVYTSQIGDGHICIPLCIGVFALNRTIPMPEFSSLSMWILLGAVSVHFFFVGVFARLPRLVGVLLIASYGVFLWKGLLK